MGFAAINRHEHYTYKDYLAWTINQCWEIHDHSVIGDSWEKNDRWEIIEGCAYNMSPAPSTFHQRILRELAFIFCTFFKEKTCEVFIAPFDVRLTTGSNKDEDIDTVVQPDLCVICDPAKLDARGCLGTPDLIVEITSPSTIGKDMKEKLLLYEKHGVKEYWIMHPEAGVVELFSANNKRKYSKPTVFTQTDRIEDKLFPGLAVDLAQIFNTEKKEKPNR